MSFDEKRDDYQGTELKHFFDIAAHRIPNDSDVNSAEALLRMLEKGPDGGRIQREGDGRETARAFRSAYG